MPLRPAGAPGIVGPDRLLGRAALRALLGRAALRALLGRAAPWAAARPLAVRAASLKARRVVSKPGQAPPPPTGTAARPSYPSGALHTSGAWSLMLLGALGCCLARSCCLLWAS